MKIPSLANTISPAVALLCVLATVFGRILLPGVTGHLEGTAVDRIELGSSVFSFAAAVGLAVLAGLAAWELSLTGRAAKNLTVQRAGVVGLAGGITAVAALAFPQPLFPQLCFGLAVACVLTLIVSATCLFDVQLTRAAGAAILLSAVVVLHRLVGYGMSQRATEPGEGLAITAQWVHAVGLVLECGVQLIVTTWVATRAPWRGRFLAHLGTGLSLVLAYVLVRTQVDETNVGVIGMLRLALASEVLPKQFALAPLDVFLTPASICLAATCALQSRMYAPLPACLALLIASRMRADVPLSALMISAAALLAVAAVRQRLRAAYEIGVGARSEEAHAGEGDDEPSLA